MKYHSGEEIRQGDEVLFHGERGMIDFIADALSGDPVRDWYIKEHGPGVMITEEKVFGRAFVRDTENAEALVLVSRRTG